MAIKSLNEAYSQNALIYICDSCGQIIPKGGAKGTAPCSEEGMTLKEQVLYKTYWSDELDCGFCVLNVDGRPAMGLEFLFDVAWCKDFLCTELEAETLNDRDILKKHSSQIFRALSDAAKTFLEDMAPGCDLYLGEDTLPDGHELMVVVPYELRDRIHDIAENLDENVSRIVREII